MDTDDHNFKALSIEPTTAIQHRSQILSRVAPPILGDLKRYLLESPTDFRKGTAYFEAKLDGLPDTLISSGNLRVFQLVASFTFLMLNVILIPFMLEGVSTTRTVFFAFHCVNFIIGVSFILYQPRVNEIPDNFSFEVISPITDIKVHSDDLVNARTVCATDNFGTTYWFEPVLVYARRDDDQVPWISGNFLTAHRIRLVSSQAKIRLSYEGKRNDMLNTNLLRHNEHSTHFLIVESLLQSQCFWVSVRLALSLVLGLHVVGGDFWLLFQWVTCFSSRGMAAQIEYKVDVVLTGKSGLTKRVIRGFLRECGGVNHGVVEAIGKHIDKMVVDGSVGFVEERAGYFKSFPSRTRLSEVERRQSGVTDVSGVKPPYFKLK